MLNQVKPRLFICKPDRTVLGELWEAYNVTSTLRLDNLNELTFDIPLFIEEDHELITNPHFKLLKNRYLIKLKTTDYVEWYVINIPAQVMTSDMDCMSITALSLAYQLNDKQIITYPVDPTKATVTNATEMLTYVLKNTVWGVGHVTTAFDLLYRSFTFSNVNVLSAIQTIATTFEGIITWDTTNRLVNLYQPEEIGTNKGLRLDYGKYLESFNYSINPDNFATRLRIYGKDGLTISGVTSTGQDYIDDTSYFSDGFTRDANKNVLTHSDYMSDSLCNALLDYKIVVDGVQGQFTAILASITTDQTNLTTKQNELTVLTDAMALINQQIDVANSAGQSTSDLYVQKVAKQTEIDNVQKYNADSIDNIKTDLVALNSQLNTIKSTVSTESNFTLDQTKELNNYIVEKSVTNSNISVASDLLAWGIKQFIKINTPDIVFEIGLVNFLQCLDPDSILDVADFNFNDLGDTITVMNGNFGLKVKSKITEIKIQYENSDMSFVITDTGTIQRDKDKILKLINDMKTTTAAVDMSSYKWNNAVVASNAAQTILANAMSAASRNINAGVNESVLINERGITSFNSATPNDLIRIANGTLGFRTLDASGNEIYKVAIDKTGVYAPVIVGELLIGQALSINSTNGAFKVYPEDVTGNIKVDIANGSLNIIGGLSQSSIQNTGFITTILNDLQSQVDGNIMTWFYSYAPSLSNLPTSDWNTDDLKNNHLGDLFYDTSTGYAYRFALVTAIYQWIKITDTDVTTALANASKAQDTADHKRRVFTVTPTPPYDLGDLWLTSLSNNTGQFKKCVNSKVTGVFTDTDWLIATDSVSTTSVYNGVKIDPINGLVVTKIVNSVEKVKSTFNATEGIKIQSYISGNWIDKFKADDDGNLIFSGNMIGGSIAIGTPVGSKYPFSVDSSGKLIASGADVSGKIICDSLYVGGSDIASQISTLSSSISGTTLSTGSTSGITKIYGNIVLGDGCTIDWVKIASVPDFVTSNNLSTILSSYTTTSALNSAIQNFVTNTALTTKLGQDYIVTGKIYANQITAGTLTGFTIQTATSGSRIVLDNNTITSWDADNYKSGVQIYSNPDNNNTYALGINYRDSFVGGYGINTVYDSNLGSLTKAWLWTGSGYPLKIESGDNMSIAPASGKTCYFKGKMDFTNTTIDFTNATITGLHTTAVFG